MAGLVCDCPSGVRCSRAVCRHSHTDAGWDAAEECFKPGDTIARGHIEQAQSEAKDVGLIIAGSVVLHMLVLAFVVVVVTVVLGIQFSGG